MHPNFFCFSLLLHIQKTHLTDNLQCARQKSTLCVYLFSFPFFFLFSKQFYPIFFFFFCPCHIAWEILAPWPGIQPVNHWTTRKFLLSLFSFFIFPPLLLICCSHFIITYFITMFPWPGIQPINHWTTRKFPLSLFSFFIFPPLYLSVAIILSSLILPLFLYTFNV